MFTRETYDLLRAGVLARSGPAGENLFHSPADGPLYGLVDDGFTATAVRAG